MLLAFKYIYNCTYKYLGLCDIGMKDTEKMWSVI